MAKYLITYQLLNSQTTGGQSITKFLECDQLTQEEIIAFQNRKDVKVHATQSVAISYIYKLEG